MIIALIVLTLVSRLSNHNCKARVKASPRTPLFFLQAPFLRFANASDSNAHAQLPQDGTQDIDGSLPDASDSMGGIGNQFFDDDDDEICVVKAITTHMHHAPDLYRNQRPTVKLPPSRLMHVDTVVSTMHHRL